MKKIQPIILSLPFILIGVAHIHLHTRTGGCWGMVEGLYSLFLYLLGGIFAFTVTVIAIIKYSKNKEILEFLPVLFSALLLVSFFIYTKKAYKIERESDAYVIAGTKGLTEDYLFFSRDMRLVLLSRNIEQGCTYAGKFEKKGDTLLLDRNIVAIQPSLLQEKYLLNEDSTLIPVQNDPMQYDSSKWLLKVRAGNETSNQ